LIKLLEKIKNPKAYVQRMIGYTDGKIVKTFQSRGYGYIIDEKRGSNGKNYDLIFYVPGKKKTLAEMDNDEQVETWGDAWEKLAVWLMKNEKI